jgi:hypothetical protein
MTLKFLSPREHLLGGKELSYSVRVYEREKGVMVREKKTDR